MQKVPQVIISPYLHDWTAGFPIDWHAEIYNIDTFGFNYIVITNAYRGITALFFKWIAIINEETLQIKYMNHIQTPNLTIGNNRTTIRIEFDKAFLLEPTVFTAFVGYRIMDGMKHYLEKSVENINTKGFDLVLCNGDETIVSWVSIAIFAVSKDRAYSVIK
jgi:hypothetical protein